MKVTKGTSVGLQRAVPCGRALVIPHGLSPLLPHPPLLSFSLPVLLRAQNPIQFIRLAVVQTNTHTHKLTRALARGIAMALVTLALVKLAN